MTNGGKIEVAGEQGSLEISPELQNQLMEAGTHEDLTAAWIALQEELNFPENTEHGTLLYWLKTTYSCFRNERSGACDSPVKGIFRDEQLLTELDQSRIPREFLLHSVRVGCLVDQLRSIAGNNRHTPADLIYPGIEPPDMINGYVWANTELRKLQEQKRREEAKRRETEAKAAETVRATQIATALTRLQTGMSDPEFEMDPTDWEVLYPEFQQRLRLWKAFTDACLRLESMQPFWTGELSEQEITPEIFAKFRAACEADPTISQLDYYDRLAFDITNPESPWFYVIIKNLREGNRTMKAFLSSAVNNMNSWFQL